MAINKQAQAVSDAIGSTFKGEFSLDQIIEDTLTGSVTWLTAIAAYFNKQMGWNASVSEDSTKWMMVDTLINNLPPKGQVTPLFKWYVTHYEQYCKSLWTIYKMMLDQLQKMGMQALADTPEFVKEYEALKEMEKRINARLVSDGFGFLQKMWSEEAEEEMAEKKPAKKTRKKSNKSKKQDETLF